MFRDFQFIEFIETAAKLIGLWWKRKPIISIHLCSQDCVFLLNIHCLFFSLLLFFRWIKWDMKVDESNQLEEHLNQKKPFNCCWYGQIELNGNEYRVIEDELTDTRTCNVMKLVDVVVAVVVDVDVNVDPSTYNAILFPLSLSRSPLFSTVDILRLYYIVWKLCKIFSRPVNACGGFLFCFLRTIVVNICKFWGW